MASSNARDFADQNRLGEYILLLASAFHVVLANLASINFSKCPTLLSRQKSKLDDIIDDIMECLHAQLFIGQYVVRVQSCDFHTCKQLNHFLAILLLKQ